MAWAARSRSAWLSNNPFDHPWAARELAHANTRAASLFTTMRWAHFIHRYPPALGGSEAYFARLSQHLVRCGDQVTVFTSNALDLESFWSWTARTLPSGTTEEDGVRIRRYSMVRWPGRRWFLKPLSYLPIRPWQCLIGPHNPICPGLWNDACRMPGLFDAVHATSLPYGFPLACGWRLARNLNIPFFVTPFLHTGDPDNPADPTRRQYTSAPMTWLLRQADRLFVQTPSEREAILQLGIDPGKVVLQGLGVDPSECTGGNRQAARARWGVADGQVALGHLANNSFEKGTIDLLKAALRLWERHPETRIILAGPDMPNFRRFWETFEPEAKGRVVRLGVLDDAGKRDFFAGIDLFALPSRSDSFGLVLLEAWANGAPNVAYRAGGVADVIRHETDGLLVRCGDIEGLSQALGDLVADPERRQRLGDAGMGRLPRDYRWRDKLDLVRSAI